MDTFEYKCPNCGGSVTWDAKTQKVRCQYCGSEFDLETLKQYDADLAAGADNEIKWDTDAGEDWTKDERDGFEIYSCESCGGEILADVNNGATTCPYCGSPVIIKNRFSGYLKPDLVVPFVYDKKQAKQALQKHFEGKPLLPSVFKNENHLDEIKGIYVPFWLFDADATARVNLIGTRRRHYSDMNYDYTVTDYYNIFRSGEVSFADVPVDASVQIDDTLMQSIEPFDTSKAVDFQTAYLSGYLADKYDVEAKDCVNTANSRIRNSTVQNVMSTVSGFDSVSARSTNVQLINSNVKYCLLPVWLLTTQWKGQNYIFAMNGQTGKFVGDLPIDKSAKTKYSLMYFGIAAAVVYILTFLLGR